MCGIFGHYFFNAPFTRAQILQILFQGLKRLEYRGYDSAGVSIQSCPGGSGGEGVQTPVIIKARGNIAALEALVWEEVTRQSLDLDAKFDHHVAIAHTRWATHGEPSARNSHPITSGRGLDFTVVHNGIITNYRELKSFLEREGQVFDTETDTEVIPKLCAYVFQNLEKPIEFSQLVMQVLQKLGGAYALLVQSVHYPGELVCCRKGSPVMFGLRNSKGAAKQRFRQLTDLDGSCFREHSLECFIASDEKAIIEHTRDAIPLEDGDVVHIKAGGWGIFNMHAVDGGAAVSRVMQKLDASLESIMKGSYTHFMEKEIHEQPESLTSTMLGRVKRASDTGDPYLSPRIVLGGLTDHVPTIMRSRRLIFVACGTSYHACLAARPLLEALTELPVALELASDLMDRRCPIFRDDTCVFVSQSGETADTLAALRYARALGALCVGVTNGVGSAISRETACGVHLNAGYEMGVASTKAYTSQIAVLIMFALLLSADSARKRPAREAIADGLLALPELVRRALALDGRMRELAMQLQHEQSLLFFGRGYNHATALEAALKVKEVALIHSEGILAGEMKHGPLALVDEELPVVVIATRDAMYTKMLSTIQQLRARMARLVVICNEGDTEVRELLAAGAAPGAAPLYALLEVPPVVECLQPIVNIVPLQLLAYHLTVLRGLNVDQPRNLAKSVTVTED